MADTNPPRFRIEIPSTGGLVIEAPTKEDCLELYREASKLPQKSRLDEAIR
jgi:hypothetical protein